jgi:hypothetical protein
MFLQQGPKLFFECHLAMMNFLARNRRNELLSHQLLQKRLLDSRAHRIFRIDDISQSHDSTLAEQHVCLVAQNTVFFFQPIDEFAIGDSCRVLRLSKLAAEDDTTRDPMDTENFGPGFVMPMQTPSAMLATGNIAIQIRTQMRRRRKRA